jgi:ketosteroid isomerase-like protein
MASVVGTYSATLRATGKPADTRGGRYLFVWNRQRDGNWKISRAITSDLEPKK